MPGKPGLLAHTGPNTAHKEADKHLYHKTKPPVSPTSEAEEIALRRQGYGDEYISQEYPKFLADLGATAQSAAHEKQLRSISEGEK